MLALIIAPLKSISPRSLRFTPLIAPLFDQYLSLLFLCFIRHIQRGELYWRCSHCYESMPAWSLL